MSQLHVIVGAGPVGSATAEMLVERGERVRIVTRSGSGPEHPAIERVAANATDAARLTELATGAVALYNCVNPRYTDWLTDWPPIAEALLIAAERSDATLVTASALYGYGPNSGTMTRSTPLAATHPKLRMRADMWREALARHEAGRIKATEVRASDYIEANGILSYGMGKQLLSGSRAYSMAPLDVKHSFTSIRDVARTLTTVATDERAWGSAWMAPTAPALTVREFSTAFAEANGAPKPKLTVIPYPVFWATGVFMPMLRELRTTRYQFTAPFVLDSSETEKTFDLEPRPLAESFRAAAEVVRRS